MALQTSKSVPSSRENKSNGAAKSTRSSVITKSTASSRRQSVQLNQPNKLAAKKKKKKKKKKESEQDPSSAQAQKPARRFVKPENQLDLTAKELEEEITRILTGDDPNKPKNVCKFSYKDKCYKPEPPGRGDNMAVHFSLEGCIMHVDSDECKKYRKKYLERGADQQEEADNANVSAERQASTAKISSGTSTASKTTSAGDHRRNQFDFSERASQTFNNPPKSQGVHTEPPPITQYQDHVSRWLIHDSYMSEYILTQTMEMQGVGSAGITFEDKLASIVQGDSESDDEDRSSTIHSKDMENALKAMERLVNQNAEDEVFHDFKYFEDRADQFRSSGEGTLLPLWRFTADRTGKKQVTSLCWNPRYNDMFAAGYGSYDFMRQGSGAVCCFSLKNTSHPEYVISTESGVMCLDFHPRYPSLLAVGCYDGTVLAYDISKDTNRPIYSSSLQSGKHSDPVWQVCWHDDGSGPLNELNFHSVSSDGRVANWAMKKNKLKMEPIMYLKLVCPAEEDAEDVVLSSLAGGCCFDFNPKLDHLFLVGTEEGRIHLCSKAYSGRYIRTYDGHHTVVHAVRWNPFHESVFVSCSADWTVKLWHRETSSCLLHFDLGNAVGDACWSPHSSTIFAAVTTDGRVHVFDLSRNKREPLCTQKVVKRARLTNAAFNARDFILIVGDDRGGVHSLKLSPNLRKLEATGGDGDGQGAAAEEGNKKGKEEEEERDNDVVQHDKMTRLLRSL